MFRADDKDGKSTYISKAIPGEKYFCPECGSEVIVKLGTLKAHHFAHKSTGGCKGSWHYDMSEWHYNWQCRFPEECREIVMEKDGVKHRADVFVDGVVYEFQHSPLSLNEFEERNRFYTSLGHKVIWIFDFNDDYEAGAIKTSRTDSDLYDWLSPRRTFDTFDAKNNKDVTLYFEFEKCEEDDGEIIPCLNKITWIRTYQYPRFRVDGNTYTYKDFIKIDEDEEKPLSLDDLKNDLYNNHKIANYGHGSLFVGCPISKTGLACSDTIDKDFGDCSNCPHNCDYYKCRYFIDHFNIPENAIVKEVCRSKTYGLIYKATYEVDGKEITESLPYREYEYKTLVELWDEVDNPESIICVNVRTGYFVKINKDPRTYRNVIYGKIKKDQYGSFPKEGTKIFDGYKPVWVMVTYRNKTDF